MSNTAFIDCQKLDGNIRLLKSQLPKGCKLSAVVKGDAYGHGIIGIAKFLDRHPDICMLIAATAREALAMIDAGVEKKILILNKEDPRELTGLLLARKDSDISNIIKQLLFSLYSLTEIKGYEVLAQKSGQTVYLHARLDFDTAVKGLDRKAFDSIKEKENPGKELCLCGMYAHLYSAYLSDVSLVKRDIRMYDEAFSTIPKDRRDSLTLHIFSSCYFEGVDVDPYDMVRVGVLLYGLQMDDAHKMADDRKVEPVLSIKGTVLRTAKAPPGALVGYSARLPHRVKQVALLSIGNWDLPHFFMCSNPAVRIGEHLCPIVGSPCMDNCLCDITGIEDIKEGDDAWFLADEDGVRFEDWVRASGLDFGDCQMLFAGIERIAKVYVNEGGRKG